MWAAKYLLGSIVSFKMQLDSGTSWLRAEIEPDGGFKS